MLFVCRPHFYAPRGAPTELAIIFKILQLLERSKTAQNGAENKRMLESVWWQTLAIYKKWALRFKQKRAVREKMMRESVGAAMV